ncbi:D-alanyl-D-alanine dipeptidase [Candidatus Jidaibacter acanthamoeba]|uniref:D-alanyl-D-alanine dipeptidase n=1 Tax=Candidatus Jidaibacter acanthamoebae TaxID=86105 RepID=A0A0C1R0P5_9RICK|nr:M15 family metallopeptidase [Candidatus Jidaibacter acanthamoeba]KIE05890.1 D-alanyl-D-alanine dipeptidase [Candidatus Jidaibacter acanthamoeba]
MLSDLKLSDNILPKGFVYLYEVDDTIEQYIMYAKSDNFTGRVVKGYEREVAICTYQAALALTGVQKELNKFNLGLKVYDIYRPVQACLDFYEWSQDVNDQKMKEKFYPQVDKKDFFDLGYVAKYSGHSRGSTVDLTVITLDEKEELDMGTRVDFIDELSSTQNPDISFEAKKNRLLLRSIMEKYGFENYSKEWWHYSLKNEPFQRKPEDHFDFPVK